ncbi:MAG: hypothetical protein KF693_00925 [Nitrospira sp.]|nr:hypothetical protein [Nitrospira sp.]
MGRKIQAPAVRLGNVIVVMNGKFVMVGEIFDAYWLKADTLPDLNCLVDQLKATGNRPDVVTFVQRVPDTEPRYDYYMEWDNVAAIPVSTYEKWFREQISSASRRNIRMSEKRGVTVRVEPYDERYVRGIMSVYDESPIRAGKKFWHYRKPFEAVEAENGTYRERSTYLGAYLQDELIGYMKIVWDTNSAAIMQIISKLEFRDRRPNNALMSHAVKLCEERGVEYLLYERLVYGNKGEDSLTRFKKENGFIRMDLPRYYIPLTLKGKIALMLGLHRDVKEMVPQRLRQQLVHARDRWYANRLKIIGGT